MVKDKVVSVTKMMGLASVRMKGREMSGHMLYIYAALTAFLTVPSRMLSIPVGFQVCGIPNVSTAAVCVAQHLSSAGTPRLFRVGVLFTWQPRLACHVTQDRIAQQLAMLVPSSFALGAFTVKEFLHPRIVKAQSTFE
ncbi:hypothetical protein K469DRAFT_8251 [Zopfia rhizophila CBS 207.26]|uniref:Uncharacterized protein n=1 Tax=Zopfia rhizophila CBS 207.26 TaxID=1314779 RepID=A0A6A6EWD5_9PEZI|nr:hypothetical protein K469DRAFT_8251 [Zopfia rhizophila CBS 207.26]